MSKTFQNVAVVHPCLDDVINEIVRDGCQGGVDGGLGGRLGRLKSKDPVLHSFGR